MKIEKDKYYIVRATHAGVFFGHIKELDGQTITMTDVRRIWYWAGAASLSQLAVDGTAKPGECKFTVYVDEMEIFETIEIIPCTEKAEESIKGVPAWTA